MEPLGDGQEFILTGLQSFARACTPVTPQGDLESSLKCMFLVCGKKSEQ